MEKKVKLINKNKFDVGIILENPHREINMKPGMQVKVSEDDVYNLNYTCTLLTRGILKVEAEKTENIEEIKQNLGFIDSEPISINQEKIQILLLGNFMKMKSELSKYTEPFAVNAIFQIAQKNIDSLSGGKIRFINEFCGNKLEIQ